MWELDFVYLDCIFIDLYSIFKHNFLGWMFFVSSQNEAISSKDNLLGGPSQISQNLSSWIARQLNLDAVGVAGAVRLFQEGSTLPFIARKLGWNNQPTVVLPTKMATVFNYIHPRKLIWQWKNITLKMYLLLKMVIFHGYVGLPGGKKCFCDKRWQEYDLQWFLPGVTRLSLTHTNDISIDCSCYSMIFVAASWPVSGIFRNHLVIFQPFPIDLTQQKSEFCDIFVRSS